jgi:hypothetical protein
MIARGSFRLLICFTVVRALSLFGAPVTLAELSKNAEDMTAVLWRAAPKDTSDHCLLKAGIQGWLPSYIVGKPYTGMAYKYGGSDDARSFRCAVGEIPRRRSAGSHSDKYGRYSTDACVVGIDCSAFVGKAWKIPIHYSTESYINPSGELAKSVRKVGVFSGAVNGSLPEAGDALVVRTDHLKHMVLFVGSYTRPADPIHRVPAKKGFCVYEATGQNAVHHVVNASDLKNWVIVRRVGVTPVADWQPAECGENEERMRDEATGIALTSTQLNPDECRAAPVNSRPPADGKHLPTPSISSAEKRSDKLPPTPSAGELPAVSPLGPKTPDDTERAVQASAPEKPRLAPPKLCMNVAESARSLRNEWSITATNCGETDIDVVTFALEGDPDFVLSAPGLAKVARNDSYPLSVKFDPRQEGIRSVRLKVEPASLVEGNRQIELKASGPTSCLKTTLSNDSAKMKLHEFRTLSLEIHNGCAAVQNVNISIGLDSTFRLKALDESKAIAAHEGSSIILNVSHYPKRLDRTNLKIDHRTETSQVVSEEFVVQGSRSRACGLLRLIGRCRVDCCTIGGVNSQTPNRPQQ